MACICEIVIFTTGGGSGSAAVRRANYHIPRAIASKQPASATPAAQLRYSVFINQLVLLEEHFISYEA